MLPLMTFVVRVILAWVLLAGLAGLSLVVLRYVEDMRRQHRRRLYEWDAEYRRLLEGEWR